MIEPVTMYRSSDGDLHDSKEEAENRNKGLHLYKLLLKAAEYSSLYRMITGSQEEVERLCARIARHSPDKLDALIAALEGK